MQQIFFLVFFMLSIGFCKANQLFYEEQFEAAYQHYIECSDNPESLFYAAICLDKLEKNEDAKLLRKKIYTEFPSSSFAEEALFFFLLDTDSPDLSLLNGSQYQAYFLALRGDFEQVIELLERPKNSYFLELKHRAYLSLATQEYAKADPIHTEYGLAHLRQSLREEQVEAIIPERDYLFALFYAQNNRPLALKWIDKSLKRTADPYLFKLLKLKGELTESMAVLEKAEKAYSPTQWPEEELLDIWMLKAKAYRKRNDEASALNQLAAIINSPVASIKRLEAMALRQEIFTSMGRIDLASRQSSALQTLRTEWKHGTLDLIPE